MQWTDWQKKSLSPMKWWKRCARQSVTVCLIQNSIFKLFLLRVCLTKLKRDYVTRFMPVVKRGTLYKIIESKSAKSRFCDDSEDHLTSFSHVMSYVKSDFTPLVLPLGTKGVVSVWNSGFQLYRICSAKAAKVESTMDVKKKAPRVPCFVLFFSFWILNFSN